MQGKGDPASRARALFKRFLAERWFGGPDFDSWVRRHAELEDELVRLRDEWFAQLADEESPATLLETHRGWRSAASFEEGEVLGGFRLHHRLGRGAMGEVWVAEELALGNRVVALKLLRPDLVPDRRALERFRREALAGARIRHPGIVAVYSAGRAQGQPYIAMELVEDGFSLAALIAAERGKGRPTAEHFRRAARLVAQAADALQAVHELGMVHRDVKPQNILVAPDDIAKVADFGLAHLAGEHGLSQTGDVVGTYCYMSPAQLRGEINKLDGRADVFSLGATLYELVTFERAFTGDSLQEITHKILYEDPPSARALGLHVPRDLELICAKALEKHPTDRYVSMAELADDLGRFLRGEPILARATSFRGRVRKWARRHPTVSVGLSVAAAGLLGITWFARVYALETRSRRAAEREALFAQAQWMSETGDLDRARSLVEDAVVLDRSDPTGHLILATGYARVGRMPESRAELRLARDKGFGEDPEEIDGALEHGAYGLYLMSQRDSRQYPEAERHLVRALELDAARYGLHFSLYLMRCEANDMNGARSALDAFQSHIPAGEPFYQVVEALRLETVGDLRAALDTLDRLRARPDMTDERLAELRWHRNAGRLCLRVREFARAEELLRRAVVDLPSDCKSWEGLAVTYLERLMDGDESPAIRAAARECAGEAQSCNPSLTNPYLVQAWVAEWELGREPLRADPRQSPSWKAAREALDRWKALPGGESEQQRELETHLLCQEVWLEGQAAYRAHDYGLAGQLFERLLELDPDHLRAAALLGQCKCHLGRHREGLEVLRRALEIWDDPGGRGKTADYWLGAILAWSLQSADKAHEQQAFTLARDRFVRELDRRAGFQKEELLSAAEFLATASPELRDCELAWRIIEEHALDTAFDGSPGKAEADEILERIASACL